MLTWSRDIHIPEPGGTAYVAGRGIFSNGPAVWGMVAPTPPQGSALPGLLGKEWEVDAPGIVMLQAVLTQLDSTTQTLYPMRIQEVQTKSGSTTAPAPGNLAYWGSTADEEAYIVTPDAPAANSPLVAGVYLYTPAKGDYCLIATGGEVIANCLAAVTNASIVGAAVFAASVGGANTAGKVDGLADATAITVALVARVIGKFMAAAANGAAVKINLDLRGLRSI